MPPMRAVTADTDVIGIKVNCSGAPNIMSSPEVVAGIVENLTAIGVPPRQIYVYERFVSQGRAVFRQSALPLLPEADPVRHRSRRAGPPPHRRHQR